jgi:Tol biopolymer transport system component
MKFSLLVRNRMWDRAGWALATGSLAIGLLAGSTGPGLAQKGGGAPPPSPEIAYVDGGINVINADGTNKVLLVKSSGAAFPCWSASGGKLAYFDSTQSGLWTVNVNGTGEARIVAYAGNGWLSHPDWSRGAAPDGWEKIAFDVMDATGRTDIWICNPDGSGLLNVTGTPGFSEKYAAWTRDSSKLVVERLVPAHEEGGVWVPAEDQMVEIQLGMQSGTLVVQGETVIRRGPGFSYLRWANGSDTVAFVQNGIRFLYASTGTEWQLSANASDRAPSFSPDDSKVLFDRSGIRVIDIATGVETLIARRGYHPYWKRPPLP